MCQLGKIFLLLLIPAVLGAQDPHVIVRTGNVEFISRNPDCNPLRREFDPVWVNGWGWTMPRVGWWGMYGGLSYGLAKGLTRLGVNRKVAAVTAGVAVRVAPHLRQAALGLKRDGVYQLNLYDWIGDAWVGTLPVWDALAHEDHSKKEYLIWAGGVAASMCWLRP